MSLEVCSYYNVVYCKHREDVQRYIQQKIVRTNARKKHVQRGTERIVKIIMIVYSLNQTLVRSFIKEKTMKT